MKTTKTVSIHGDIEWKLPNGKRHRTDGPAVEGIDGSKYWFLNGKLHREDGPAVERADGTKFWCLNGKYHRVDGPAFEWIDGSKYWYLNGKILDPKEYVKSNDGECPELVKAMIMYEVMKE